MWPWIALLVALLLAGGGVAAYLLTRPEKRTVPDVTGRTLNTARTVLQNEGFVVNVLDVTSDNKAGTVIGQQPQGNTQGRRGLNRHADRLDGTGEHDACPRSSGCPRKPPSSDLARARLKFRTQHETSDSIPAGRATRTQPADGQSVPVGTRVTLFISSGRPLVTVPNVVGQSEGAARAQLADQGFRSRPPRRRRRRRPTAT